VKSTRGTLLGPFSGIMKTWFDNCRITSAVNLERWKSEPIKIRDWRIFLGSWWKDKSISNYSLISKMSKFK